MARTKVRMCARCAGAFNYIPNRVDETPNTHEDVGEECPTLYR